MPHNLEHLKGACLFYFPEVRRASKNGTQPRMENDLKGCREDNGVKGTISRNERGAPNRTRTHEFKAGVMGCRFSEFRCDMEKNVWGTPGDEVVHPCLF